MAPLDFQKQYNKYKDIIVEEIIQEFGEEYRDIIKERINSHVIILQSNPLDDYTYACKHHEKIKFTDRLIIKERYRKLEHIKEKARNDLMHEFQWSIMAFFKIDENIIFSNNPQNLVSLFGNENFDASYIDSYSFDSMNLLNREDIPSTIKENILRDQSILRESLEKYGISIDDDFISQVDNFIDKRNLEKEGYYYRILNSNFIYNKELSKYLPKDARALFRISFYQNAHRSIIIKNGKEEIKYVFCPIIKLINLNLKGLDICFIHELVHTIQREPVDTIGEIVVQKAAINITNRLHNNEIFLFDNPDDYKIMGECGYEPFFPVIEPILSNYYDSILKNTLINSNFSSLGEVFGESWDKFLLELENLFLDFKKINMKTQEGFIWQADLSRINQYMQEIGTFYNRGGKHV